jgi:tetratricopeptide (TPR) repeat protein
MRTVDRRALIAGLLAAALLAGCSDKPGTGPHPCEAQGEGREPLDGHLVVGRCLLQAGETASARDRFERAVELAPDHSEANFLAGFAGLLLVVNDLYVGMYDASLLPESSFTGFQRYLVETIAGDDLTGGPAAGGRLDRIASRFEQAGADPAFRTDVHGYVLRLRELPVYVDHYEFDTGDGLFLAGVTRLLQGFIRFLAAYNLDVPTSMILNKAEPIYSILNLDLETALTEHLHFFDARRVDGTEVAGNWLAPAKEDLKRGLRAIQDAIAQVMTEQDNQSQPDLDDVNDYLSKPFLTRDGHIYIPAIFGPAPTTAILSMLFKGDRTAMAEALRGFFPNTPDTFPDAYDHVLAKLLQALDGEPILINGVDFFLSDLFDAPQSTRVYVELLQTLLDDGSGGGLPWAGGGSGLPNRTDPDALPWEHPELYEPVPTAEELEADDTRGIDGPAAEFHVGNGYILAGLTREGRLKNLFFPGTTSYNLVPYITRVTHPYLETEPIPYMGANPEHGSFAGVRVNGNLEWLMDRLDHRRINPNTTEGRAVVPRYAEPGVPVVEIQYTDPSGMLDVIETAFVPQIDGEPEPLTAVVRRFAVTNVTDATLTAEFVYYGAFNVTDIDQYVLGARFSANWLLSENSIRTEGADAIVWTGPGWTGHPDGPHTAIMMSGSGPGAPTEVGIGTLGENGNRGAFDDAVAATPSADPVDATRFANGYLAWPLGSLDPGQQSEVTVFLVVAAGGTADEAAQNAGAMTARLAASTVGDLRQSTETSWRNWLDGCDIPDASMSTLEAEVFRMAAMALKLSQSALTGALPEMLDMQPMWFMVWPGSAVWQASALDAMGRHAEAERYFDFAAQIQANDGFWRMAYTTLGEYHGAFALEYYMTPSLVWFAWAHWQITGDDAWLQRVWPTVRKAADFVAARRASNGLLYASPDFVEDMTAFRQSLYTNTIGVSGLRAAVEMARALGEMQLADQYDAAASELYQAVVNTFWDDHEQQFWKFHDMHGMHGHGAEPSMIWPYHVFDFDDPRVEMLVTGHLDEHVARQDFITFQDSDDWTPGLMMKTAFYVHHYLAVGRQQSLDNARFLLDGMLAHRTLAGFIPERYFGHGVTGSGKPLLWPHAAYILTQHALARQQSPLPLLPLPPEPQ